FADYMPQAISSTAQDLERGRPTEIDYLNGYIVRECDARGLQAPVNRTLNALVQLLEQAPPSPRLFAGWRSEGRTPGSELAAPPSPTLAGREETRTRYLIDSSWNTSRPPTYVSNARIVGIFAAGIVSRSSDNTAKSASLPGSIEPLMPASPVSVA